MENNYQKSILLVDDDKDIVNTLVPPLRNNGFKVAPFTNPIEAFSYFKEHHTRFHSLVSDVRMPGMSGFELVRNVKQINPQIKALLLTGFEIDRVTLEKLREFSGVDHVLYKPISAIRIIEVLSSL